MLQVKKKKNQVFKRVFKVNSYINKISHIKNILDNLLRTKKNFFFFLLFCKFEGENFFCMIHCRRFVMKNYI
jgi:hypothetical protein